MTEKQYIHVAMINSFNLLVNAASIDELVRAGLPMLAHDPIGDVTSAELDNIIDYFESIEMYEKCSKLKKLYIGFDIKNNNYEVCECDFPVITRYTSDIRCEKCRKRIVK
jgi:hypothetical protein